MCIFYLVRFPYLIPSPFSCEYLQTSYRCEFAAENRFVKIKRLFRVAVEIQIWIDCRHNYLLSFNIDFVSQIKQGIIVSPKINFGEV